MCQSLLNFYLSLNTFFHLTLSLTLQDTFIILVFTEEMTVKILAQSLNLSKAQFPCL